MESFAKKENAEEDDLINYYSHFCPVAEYLIDKKKISMLERDRGFWSNLPKALRTELKLWLDMANGNRDRTVIPAMDDVMKVARAALADSDSDSDSDDESLDGDSSSDSGGSSNDSDSSESDDRRRRKKKGKEKRKKGGVKTKRVTFEGGKTRGEEIDDLTKQLPKLNIQPRPFACYFCDDSSHRMWDCLLVLQYVKIGRVAWKDGRLVFSGKDGEPIRYNPSRS